MRCVLLERVCKKEEEEEEEEEGEEESPCRARVEEGVRGSSCCRRTSWEA